MNDPTEPDQKQNEYESGKYVTKKLALIRHAEALHNIDSKYFSCADNALTKAGTAQCMAMRQKLLKEYKKEFYDTIGVVFTSPLLRALQTTHAIFDGKDISIRVCSDHTELWSATCDEGTDKQQLLQQYPAFKSFTGWDTIKDKWWPRDIESEQDIEQRQISFAKKLIEHEQSCIAAVGHSSFLRSFTDRFGDARNFGNAEVNWYTLIYETEKQTFSLKHIQRIKPPKK